MNKKVDKKYYIIAVALTLIATMLMVPITNAITITWAQCVVTSSNVTNPQNILGPPDGNYARFNPTEAKLIVKLRTSPSSSVISGIYGYTTSGVVKVNIYMTYDPYGTWVPAGYIYVGTTIGWYWSNGAAPGNNVGFSVNLPTGVYLYADSVEFKY